MTSDDYASYLDRTDLQTAMIEAGPANRLALALDRDDPPFAPGDVLPDGWHWLTFLEAHRAGLYTSDGRGTKAGLLPDFDGLSRMWAGGAFTFLQPLRIGDRVERRARVAAITPKTGRAGRLIIGTLETSILGPAGEAVRERQDLVFREPRPYAGPANGERADGRAAWRRTVVPDEVLLFRISALTYNSHRIHYDWRYATESEGYPGLLVHGPLSCLLLLDLVRRNVPGRRLSQFDYRALRPMFCGHPMTVCGRPIEDDRLELWIEDHQGFLAMRGFARLG